MIQLERFNALVQGECLITFIHIYRIKSLSTRSGQMGAQHMVLNEEQVAFSDWINTNLARDKDVAHLLPLNVSRYNVDVT